MEEFPGTINAVRREIESMCSEAQPNSTPAAVVSSQSDVSDSSLTGVERLLKRRRVSGDQGTVTEHGSESVVSTVKVEMANYEKMQV